MRLAILTVLAALAFTAVADEAQIQKDAPERYTVKKGDTLWGISERFLKNPWKWPEVWQLNREQIKNPHLIYPGDTVILIRGAQPRLVLERGIKTVKLSPQVRAEPLAKEDEGIPSIPYEAIAQLLNQGGIIGAEDLVAAPRILGGKEDRVLYAAGDQVYASASDATVPRWEIVRQGKPVLDPDSGETLGHLLEHVGMMRMIKPGTPALFQIERTSQEVVERDHLQPHFGSSPMQFAPHAPDKAFEGKVAATLGGAQGAGTYTTVVLNKGHQDGLEPGHVLGVYRAGRSLADPRCQRAEKLAFLSGSAQPTEAECKAAQEGNGTLPETRVGVVFVYRVFKQAAYALVMKSDEPVYVKDTVKNP